MYTSFSEIWEGWTKNLFAGLRVFNLNLILALLFTFAFSILGHLLFVLGALRLLRDSSHITGVHDLGYSDYGNDTPDSWFDGSSPRNECALRLDPCASECARVAVVDELGSSFSQWHCDVEGESVQAYKVNCAACLRGTSVYVYHPTRQSNLSEGNHPHQE